MNETAPTGRPTIPPEQAAYARVLSVGCALAAVVLLATFAVYVLGLRPAHVPIHDVPNCWSMPSREYLQATKTPLGWQWATEVADSDFANNVGICLLAGISGLAYLRVAPIFLRKRQFAFLAIVVAELLIMLVAASGLLVARH